MSSKRRPPISSSMIQEDKLHSGGHCWACVLGNLVDELLTDPATRSIPHQLLPLAAALKPMKPANSGLTGIRQEHVTSFLRKLAVAPEITHEAVDELSDPCAREYVPGLPTERAVLPRRDEFPMRYDNGAFHAAAAPASPSDPSPITSILSGKSFINHPLPALSAYPSISLRSNWHLPTSCRRIYSRPLYTRACEF